MLVEFSCANVRSIKEPVHFTMESEKDRSLKSNLIYDENFGANYLRFAEILGENGSGKTSFLVALSLLHDLIMTNAAMLHGQPLMRIPHKLAQNLPTAFLITFVQNGVRFKYSLEYDNNAILSESLYYWPGNRISLIFKRRKENYEISNNFPKLVQAAKDKIDYNKLLLVIGSQDTPYIELKNAISFFTRDLVIYSPGPNNWLNYSAGQIANNPVVYKKVLDFLRSLGINVAGINARLEQRPLMPNEVPFELGEQFRQMAMSQVAVIPHIELDYGDFCVDYNEESAGIQSLLQFLCPLFDIFENSKVFLCDEIESHLHPSAVRQIIKLFNSNQNSKAQIILTTHDINLLDIDILRRDQIWFSAMSTEERSSNIFRLSGLKGVRKDDNLKKNYLEGKYKKMWAEQNKK